jgi:hypothetical protein
MEALDLTKQPPRSPYEKLDGLYMMPRTLDKLRATLPGGKAGDYHVDGLSRRLLDAIGVKEEDLLKAVASARSDDDVAAWLLQHADHSKYDEINRVLSQRSYEDIVDKDSFNKKYPQARSSKYKLLFDLVLEDDRANFAEKSRP